MASGFTNAGEFSRGKGAKSNRLGPRQRVDTGRRSNRQTQTPDDIAVRRLNIVLENKGMDERNRRSYEQIMRRGDQLRFMNMSVLAQVLIYMNSINNQVDDISAEGIKNQVDQMIKNRAQDFENATRKPSEESLRISSLRLSATFIRYIYYFFNIIQASQEEADLAEINMGVTSNL